MFIRPRNISGIDYLRKDAVAHCSHPYKVRHYDWSKKEMVDVEVPCGSCDYCQYIHQQQWVKRMQYESMPDINKYCYFITLTYDSAYLKKDKAMSRELYSVKRNGEVIPLLLCRKHLQLFFARLRKYTGKKFTYYACGEYGETYSRPHFHIVLWSDDSFQKNEIEQAWSKSDTLIGIVDFHNLVENGTLSDLRSDSINSDVDYDSKSAFKYVAKYVNKMSDENLLDKMYTKNLIQVAFKRNYIKTKVFDHPLNRDETHKKKHYFRNKIKNILDKNEELQKFSREDYQPHQEFRYKTCEEFFKQFLPYKTSSTDNAIGTRYVEKYIQSEGDLLQSKKDKYTGQAIYVPISFKRSIERQITPIVPLSLESFSPRYGEQDRVNELLDLLQNHTFKKYDEDNWYSRWSGKFFVGCGELYYLQKEGVRRYDFASGEYLGEYDLIQFTELLKMSRYISYMEEKQFNTNKFYQDKDDYLEEQKQLYFKDNQEYLDFAKTAIKDKKYELSRNQLNWLFKHKNKKIL